MTDPAAIIAEHYQRTCELTLQMRAERNRAFVTLLLLTGGGALLLLGADQSSSLLIHWLASQAGITDPQTLSALQGGFPFKLVQISLLAAVFYVMATLYHRTVSVLRYYDYLGKLEEQLRRELGAPDGIAFTRESTFYWGGRPRFLGLNKWAFAGMVALVLLTLFGGRARADLLAGDYALLAADVVIGAPTLAFCWAYIRESVGFERRHTHIGRKAAP